uniref:Uncharacterized protein n=1 Tax=Cyanoderma ruficeps TaxID=181631 RepID=A0A8C3QNX0_9PASS
MLHQAWQLCGKWCRWSSPFIHLLALTVVTFGVLVPLICHHLLHSYFVIGSWSRTSRKDALHYFERCRCHTPTSKGSGSDAFQPLLLITIITVQRQNDFHYIWQVPSHFHRLLHKCGVRCQSHHMLLCNVESDPSSHQDVRLLSSLFPMVSCGRTGENPDPSLNNLRRRNNCLRERSLSNGPSRTPCVTHHPIVRFSARGRNQACSPGYNLGFGGQYRELLPTRFPEDQSYQTFLRDHCFTKTTSSGLLLSPCSSCILTLSVVFCIIGFILFYSTFFSFLLIKLYFLTWSFSLGLFSNHYIFLVPSVQHEALRKVRITISH